MAPPGLQAKHPPTDGPQLEALKGIGQDIEGIAHSCGLRPPSFRLGRGLLEGHGTAIDRGNLMQGHRLSRTGWPIWGEQSAAVAKARGDLVFPRGIVQGDAIARLQHGSYRPQFGKGSIPNYPGCVSSDLPDLGNLSMHRFNDPIP